MDSMMLLVGFLNMVFLWVYKLSDKIVIKSNKLINEKLVIKLKYLVKKMLF